MRPSQTACTEQMHGLAIGGLISDQISGVQIRVLLLTATRPEQRVQQQFPDKRRDAYTIPRLGDYVLIFMSHWAGSAWLNQFTRYTQT